MTPTPDELLTLLSQTGLGSREAAKVLRMNQVGLNERQFRHYLSGRAPCPEIVYRALRDLANEKTNTQ